MARIGLGTIMTGVMVLVSHANAAHSLDDLQKACREADLKAFQEIFAEYQGPADARNEGPSRRTSLQWAVTAPAARADERLAIVQALLARGADPRAFSKEDGRDKTTLRIALDGEWDEPLLRTLLQAGADPLQAATSAGMVSPLAFAAGCYDAAAVKILVSALPKDFDKNALNAALRAALATGYNSNWPPNEIKTQREAAYRTVVLLLDAGADPMAADSKGFSALQYAARTNSPEIISEMLSRTPKHAKLRNGRTLLHEIVMEPALFNPAAFALLVRLARIPVDSVDADGNTPLHEAVRQGNDKAVAALLLLGVNARIRNAEGRVPLEMSQSRSLKDETETLLQKYTVAPLSEPDPEPKEEAIPVTRSDFSRPKGACV